nr:sensor domain-containing diguanylate cyclase [Motiliproteus sediminis]
MRKTLASVDLDIWYVLEESVYLESIIELKNRVIAATVIILWASIWIVLIVAYRIARPIRDLTDATKDMQESEYSAPLNYKKTGDEVSDLGQRFEEMRLHIEGLISRDPLSGLFNRRYLMHALEIEINKAKRGEQPLCCLMMDLDHFKNVNDTYGHQCGDKVIQTTAEIIQRSLRNYDICARYGGEEFVVILPMTTLQAAKEVAERIRETVQNSPVEWEGETISPTVSVGVSVFATASDDSNGEVMIGVADEALYLAKRAGRNCVMDGTSVANLME